MSIISAPDLHLKTSAPGTGSYRGIIPPLVTPLNSEGALDRSGLEKLIEHVLNGGVHGLFILGTTGEGPSLGYDLRREMIARTCGIVGGRVPVLVGITDTAESESLRLAEHAAESGVDAVVIAPPYYFAPAQTELIGYFEHLAEALPLPFFLYNMPALTKVVIGEEAIRRSLSMERCLGLKDSSGDLVYYKKALRIASEKPGYRILIGPEELLAESLLAGGDGGVSGGANVFPSLYVGVFEAMECGDFTEAVRLQKLILEVSCRLYGVGQYGSAIIRGIKCALHCQGICEDFMAPPYRERFRTAERKRIEEELRTLISMLPQAAAVAA